MSKFLSRFKSNTRWDTISNEKDAYRLSCSHATCSLSCANLRGGRLALTSIHGTDRHSYVLTKNDMAFLTALFLTSLPEDELRLFLRAYNKISDTGFLNFEEF